MISTGTTYVTACGFIVKITETRSMPDGGVGFVGCRMSRDREGYLYQEAPGWYYTESGLHCYGDPGLTILGTFVDRA